MKRTFRVTFEIDVEVSGEAIVKSDSILSPFNYLSEDEKKDYLFHQNNIAAALMQTDGLIKTEVVGKAKQSNLIIGSDSDDVPINELVDILSKYLPKETQAFLDGAYIGDVVYEYTEESLYNNFKIISESAKVEEV